MIIFVSCDFTKEGKLSLCNLVLDGGDVTETHTKGVVCDEFVDYLGDGDAEYSLDALMKKSLEFL